MHEIIQPTGTYQTYFHVYFLIGQPEEEDKPEVQASFKNESETYRDIIEYDQIDNYDALPDKTFAGYQFVAKYCREKEYVLFVDDDVFVKIHQIKEEMNV